MRISDWSSDVCSSDLIEREAAATVHLVGAHGQPVAEQAVVLEEKRPFDTQVTQYVFGLNTSAGHAARGEGDRDRLAITDEGRPSAQPRLLEAGVVECDKGAGGGVFDGWRSEEHTSELQSLMRISYAVFCLQNKNNPHTNITIQNI